MFDAASGTETAPSAKELLRAASGASPLGVAKRSDRSNVRNACALACGFKFAKGLLDGEGQLWDSQGDVQ